MRDQSALGLTRLDRQDQRELSPLTAAYRDKFGFPLIMPSATRDRDQC